MTKKERIEKFKAIMEKVERKGIDRLSTWLIDESDYFTCPASPSHHNNYEGGLFDHCVNVTEFALSVNNYVVKRHQQEAISQKSIIIVCMFHDLCKVGTYEKGEKWGKDERNKWQKYPCYVYKGNVPLGHGEKSLYITGKFLELTDDEALAIRWHMGFIEPGVHFGYPAGMQFNDAMDVSNLTRLVQVADLASGMVEKTIDYKAKAGLT